MALFTDLLVNVLGIVTALLAIGIAYYKWSFQYWKRRNVPYLEPSIPFGNFINPMKRTVSLGINIQNLYKQAKSKGLKHCGIFNMAVPTYLVIDLEIAKHVLTKDFSYFTDRGFYTNEKVDPIGAHLFSVGNPKWRNLRVKMSPAFTSGKLKGMFQTLVNNGSNLGNFLEKNIDGITGLVDIKQALAYYTIDNIGSCAFGLDCNSFEIPNSPFKKHGDNFFVPGNVQAFKTAFNMNFPKIARTLGLRDVPRNVSDFFMSMVKDAVAYREKNNYTKKDFLQSLIEMKNNPDALQNGHKGDGKLLTMDEVAAQSFVIFLAGYETSATTMTFAMYELALHPEVQQRLREEIKMVLAKHDDQFTYESLNEMKYMMQVIDETFRKHPPVTFITREAVADYKIPDENLVLEKGTRMMIPILGYHHDEEYYKNPTVFDPERFNDENRKKIHPYAHIPFGAGPRLCLGERFGLMQVQVGLASILKSFKVTLNPKTEVPIKMHTNSILAAPEGGVWINVSKI